MASDPRQLVAGNPEVHVVGDAERLGDQLAQGLRERVPGCATYQLTEYEPEGQRVIAGRRPRRPPRLLGGDEGAHPVPVGQVLGRDPRPQAGHSHGVEQHVAQCHVVLAVCRELRPDLRHALVVVEFAALDEYVCDRGRDPLSGRGGEEQGVRLDRPGGRRIGDPGARVDDGVPLVEDRDLETGLTSRGDGVVQDRLDPTLRVGRRAHVENLRAVWLTAPGGPASPAVASSAAMNAWAGRGAAERPYLATYTVRCSSASGSARIAG